MSREKWYTIQHMKGFYVRTYHWVQSALLLSCWMNVILLILISYAYFSRTQPNFYATSGETFPVQLTSMNHPNYGKVALLASDTVVGVGSEKYAE